MSISNLNQTPCDVCGSMLRESELWKYVVHHVKYYFIYAIRVIFGEGKYLLKLNYYLPLNFILLHIYKLYKIYE